MDTPAFDPLSPGDLVIVVRSLPRRLREVSAAEPGHPGLSSLVATVTRRIADARRGLERPGRLQEPGTVQIPVVSAPGPDDMEGLLAGLSAEADRLATTVEETWRRTQDTIVTGEHPDPLGELRRVLTEVTAQIRSVEHAVEDID